MVMIFFMLFRKRSHIFFRNGISTPRFVKNAPALRAACLWPCPPRLRLVADKGQHLIDVEIDNKTLLVLLLVGDRVGLAPADLFDLRGI